MSHGRDEVGRHVEGGSNQLSTVDHRSSSLVIFVVNFSESDGMLSYIVVLVLHCKLVVRTFSKPIATSSALRIS
jgi:hypothetical protein